MQQFKSPATVALITLASLLAGCGSSGPSPDGGGGPAAQPPSEAAAAIEPAGPETVADLFPEGAGRPLVLETCGSCHAVACAVIGQRLPARWENLKEDHRDKVSNLSQQDLKTVFAYLKEHFNSSRPEPNVPRHFLEGGCTPF